jgi:hypothetical protein
VLLAIGGVACGDDGGSATSDDDTTDEATDEPSDGVSADEWVASLCMSLDDWLANLEEATEDVQDVLGLQGQVGRTGDSGDTGTDTGGADDVDLDEQKELLVDFLDTAISLTDTLVDEIEDAGVPDVEDGEEIADVFVTSFGDAGDTFEEAREQAEDLPTDDPDDFADEVLEIGDEIDIAAIEIQTAFNELSDDFDTEELDEAFNDEEACQELDV